MADTRSATTMLVLIVVKRRKRGRPLVGAFKVDMATFGGRLEDRSHHVKHMVGERAVGAVWAAFTHGAGQVAQTDTATVFREAEFDRAIAPGRFPGQLHFHG